MCGVSPDREWGRMEVGWIDLPVATFARVAHKGMK